MPDLLAQQIADDLRAKIGSGLFAPGQRMKSQRELRTEYAKALSRPVSANVIRAAAAVLAVDGLVEIRPGRGTFVASAAALPRPSGPPLAGSAGSTPPVRRKAWPGDWDYRTTTMFSFAVMQPYLWLRFFSSQRETFTGIGMVISSILIVVTAIGILLAVGDSLPGNLIGLAYSFSALTYLFSTLYWGYGGTSNFSTSLTRLDAIYFSVGTLTTAGTGNISATSELSRGLQTTQMGLDFVLVVFVAAVVIPRLIRLTERSVEPGRDLSVK